MTKSKVLISLLSLVSNSWSDYFKGIDYQEVTGTNPAALRTNDQNVYFYKSSATGFTTSIIAIIAPQHSMNFLLEDAYLYKNTFSSKPGAIDIRTNGGGAHMYKVGAFDNSASISKNSATFALFKITEEAKSNITFLSSLNADNREESSTSHLMVQSTATMSHTNVTHASSPVIFQQFNVSSKFSFNNFESCRIVSFPTAMWLTYATISYSNYVKNSILNANSVQNSNIRTGQSTSANLVSYLQYLCFNQNDVDYLVYSFSPVIVTKCYIDYGVFYGTSNVGTFDNTLTYITMELLATGDIETRILTPMPTNKPSTNPPKDLDNPNAEAEKFNQTVIIITAIAAFVVVSCVIIWFVVKCMKFRKMKKVAAQKLIKSDDNEEGKDNDDEETNETNYTNEIATRDNLETNNSILIQQTTAQPLKVSTLNPDDIDSEHSVKIEQDESESDHNNNQ